MIDTRSKTIITTTIILTSGTILTRLVVKVLSFFTNTRSKRKISYFISRNYKDNKMKKINLTKDYFKRQYRHYRKFRNVKKL